MVLLAGWTMGGCAAFGRAGQLQPPFVIFSKARHSRPMAAAIKPAWKSTLSLGVDYRMTAILRREMLQVKAMG
jgi:hypothetical protein